MKKHDPTRIIDAAAARAGYNRKRAEMCRLAAVPLSTFNAQRAKGDYPLSVIHRLNGVLHFTEEECRKLIGG